MAADDDEMFITISLNITPKTLGQHLIERINRSVAYVTNNKRLCSTFGTIEANYAYWHTRSIARPLCVNRATCVMMMTMMMVIDDGDDDGDVQDIRQSLLHVLVS